MLKVGAQVGCDATALEKFRRPERGAPVSYPYSFEDLLALLHGRAPAKVDAVALHRRRVEHGHLSVGLKIHCLGDGSQFSTLVEGLGGAQKILDVNYYKHCHASLCLVLPPVGSARSAILLLECIEQWVWTDDPESDDDEFFAALQELVAYAFEESVRIKKKGRLFPGWHEIPVRSSRGILQEVQSLLQKYRNELVTQSRLLDQGGRA